MNKLELRKEFLEKRVELTQEEWHQRNEKIKILFFQEISVEKVDVLHTFLPITKHNEINVWPIISQLRAMKPQLTILTSKSDLSSFTMTSFILKPETIITANRWGIPEPDYAESFEDQKINMILVPLLTFDKKGHRVGYGKGFYDRFVQKCAKDVIKVGLSLEAPVDYIPDVHPGDMLLDYCITPKQVYKF